MQALDSAAEESPLFFEIAAPTFANTSFQIFVKWAPGYVERGWRGWLASADHHWQDWLGLYGTSELVAGFWFSG